MGRSAVGKIFTGLVQAEHAIDREADFAGILVLLAIILPPANGAQSEGAGRFQRLVSATGTTKTCLRSFHASMDEVQQLRVYTEEASCCEWLSRLLSAVNSLSLVRQCQLVHP